MYRSTQQGTLLFLFMSIPITIIIVVGIQASLPPFVWVVVAVLALTAYTFRSLTIEIDTDELRCYFGGGLIRRRFPLSAVLSAEVVRNRWYYGWGIKRVPKGWMFNVSGLDAVEIRLASGRRFRMGTDRPHEVVEAFERYRTLAGKASA